MEIVRYFVSKDYSEDYPAVGRVTIADFYNMNDAIEYYRWKSKSLRGLDVAYKFYIGKRTETIDDEGHMKFIFEPVEIPPSRRPRRGS